MTTQTVRFSQTGVHQGSDGDQSARHRLLQVVGFLHLEFAHAGLDGLAADALASLSVHDFASRSDFNLVAHLQYAFQNASPQDSSLEILHKGSWFVDVERADHYHPRRHVQDAFRHRNCFHDVLQHVVRVEPTLGGNGYDRRVFGDAVLGELFDGLLLVQRVFLALDQVDFVLQNNKLLHLHDFDSCQMLAGLRLRAGFVGGHEQQTRVHDCGAIQHGGHEHVVAGAVHETHVAFEQHQRVALFADGFGVLLAGAERLVALGFGADGALVDFGIGLAEFDCDVADLFGCELLGTLARDGVYDCALAMGHVSDGADVDGGLVGNHTVRDGRALHQFVVLLQLFLSDFGHFF
mmetsp:Transcript_36647/g.79795  ORF Transcript_36647/g.79795 Transcript_36647/m.79795 type:complete len:350 (-) Transcript_36647:123-1172(-)